MAAAARTTNKEDKAVRSRSRPPERSRALKATAESSHDDVTNEKPRNQSARRRAAGTQKRRSSGSEVIICWRKAPGDETAAQQAARDAVETVLGHIQRRLDAEVAFAPARRSVDEHSPTAQSAEPISFVEARERVLGLIGEYGHGPTHALTDKGRRIALKPRARRRGPGKFGEMADGPSFVSVDGHRRRRPAVVNVRPGQGGARRRDQAVVDPTDGLDEYGEAIWWPAPGPGTMLGQIVRNPDGNAVAVCRLSGEDRDDTLVDQVAKAVALEAANPDELVIRYILLALNMSGTREVRGPRSLPPPAGVFERDDILRLQKWFREGWVEHAIWRDGRRMAREILPAEMILHSLREHRVNLWLTATYGRMIDWRSDRLGIRALNLVSAEDRDHIERSLQDARLSRGPLAGKGWRNAPPRFGFMRDPRSLELHPDPEQEPWIHRAFELADIGDFEESGGLSTRALTERLKQEGCPFDHDRVRQILKDPIYATGEWYANVRGVPVVQSPVFLNVPVPLDRFLRVQIKLGLRQGSTKRTPLGEFLFNYVEVVHKQCDGEHYKNGSPILVKGFVEAGREHKRVLRHSPKPPDCCKGGGRGLRGAFVWEREDLEPPVVEQIRRLVDHPAILQEAAVAVRHEIIETCNRLTSEQRQHLEGQLLELDQRLEVAAEEWVERAATDSSVDLEDYQRVVGALKRKREALRLRLKADDEAGDTSIATPDNARGLRDAFLEILTVETPSDPLMLQLRARLFQSLVSRVVIDDDGDLDKPIVLTIEGHLVPGGAEAAASPLVAGHDLLTSYLATRDGEMPEAERKLAELERLKLEVASEGPDAETAYQYGYHKSVSALNDHFYSATRTEVRRWERADLQATHWQMRRGNGGRSAWAPAWRLEITVEPAGADHDRIVRRLGHPTAVRIVDAIGTRGEATIADIAEATGLHKAGVRNWIARLCQSGTVVQARGRGTPRSPAVYAVAYDSLIVDCAPTR